MLNLKHQCSSGSMWWNVLIMYKCKHGIRVYLIKLYICSVLDFHEMCILDGCSRF